MFLNLSSKMAGLIEILLALIIFCGFVIFMVLEKDKLEKKISIDKKQAVFVRCKFIRERKGKQILGCAALSVLVWTFLLLAIYLNFLYPNVLLFFGVTGFYMVILYTGMDVGGLEKDDFLIYEKPDLDS